MTSSPNPLTGLLHMFKGCRVPRTSLGTSAINNSDVVTQSGTKLGSYQGHWVFSLGVQFFLSRHRQKWTEGIDDSQTTADSEFTGDFSTNANFSHQFWPLKTPNESAFITKCNLINVYGLLQRPALLNMVGSGELNGELSTNSWDSNVTFGWTSPAQSCTHPQRRSYLCKLIKQTNLGLNCEQQRFYLSALPPEFVCQ